MNDKHFYTFTIAFDLKITKSIDKSDLGVINALVELDSYVNAQNELISKANKAAEESFFGNLKLFLKIK